MTFLLIIVTLGYTYKKGITCSISGDMYSSYDEALNACNADSRCKCFDCIPKNSRCYTYTSGPPYEHSAYQAWVITAI